jgi:hypothetical protein
VGDQFRFWDGALAGSAGQFGIRLFAQEDLYRLLVAYHRWKVGSIQL